MVRELRARVAGRAWGDNQGMSGYGGPQHCAWEGVRFCFSADLPAEKQFGPVEEHFLQKIPQPLLRKTWTPAGFLILHYNPTPSHDGPV